MKRSWPSKNFQIQSLAPRMPSSRPINPDKPGDLPDLRVLRGTRPCPSHASERLEGDDGSQTHTHDTCALWDTANTFYMRWQTTERKLVRKVIA